MSERRGGRTTELAQHDRFVKLATVIESGQSRFVVNLLIAREAGWRFKRDARCRRWFERVAVFCRRVSR